MDALASSKDVRFLNVLKGVQENLFFKIVFGLKIGPKSIQFINWHSTSTGLGNERENDTVFGRHVMGLVVPDTRAHDIICDRCYVGEGRSRQYF